MSLPYFLDLTKAESLLGIGKHTLRRAYYAGEVDGFKKKRKVMFRSKDLIHWMEDGKVEIPK